MGSVTSVNGYASVTVTAFPAGVLSMASSLGARGWHQSCPELTLKYFNFGYLNDECIKSTIP
jgi:hypothetical protein